MSVYIVGGGAAGLAMGVSLLRHGVRSTILERGPDVGMTWRSGYDRLHLHTTRRWSSLPGYPIPSRYGRWLPRDAVIEYLGDYRERFDLDVRTGVDVTDISPSWTITTADGESMAADTVVIATGYNHTPVIPAWPGAFDGELRHARDYRNPSPYEGKDVLVVGVGNTGAEIAADLAFGGARTVWIAIRTPPHIVRRDTAGWPAQATGIIGSKLPVPVVDRVAALQRRLTMPDLTPYGVPLPAEGLGTRASRDRAIPVQDVGFVKAVQEGRVKPVAAVASLDGDKVTLADGSSVRPDAIIAATGYRRGLEDLVGSLGVLDDKGLPRTRDLPRGLHFLGYRVTLAGFLRDIAHDAPALAAKVYAERASRS